MATKATMYFHSVEHDGDLDQILDALCEINGVEISDSKLCSGETAKVTVQVEDVDAFVTAFVATPEAGQVENGDAVGVLVLHQYMRLNDPENARLAGLL